MKRINKNIVLFSGILLVVGFALISISGRLPRLLTHETYFCSSNFFSIVTPVPGQLLLLPFIVLGALLLVAVFKLIAIALRTHQLKMNLSKNVYSDDTFSRTLHGLRLEDKALLISDPKPFAFCLGIIQPKIYVSTGLFQIVTEKELEAILYHEQYHIKNHDALTMILGQVNKTLFPFLPILSDLLQKYQIEREVHADEEAIIKSGNKLHLISVLKKFLINPSPFIAYAPAIYEHNTFEPRINAIINKRDGTSRSFTLKNIFISFAFIFIIAFALVGPVHAMHVRHDGTHIMMLHSTADTCLETNHHPRHSS